MNKEREFINYFKTKVDARYQRSQDKDKQNHHVTIRDVSSDVVFEALKAEGYTLTDSSRTHSSAYVGKKIVHNNNDIYVVVRDKNSSGVHYMKRKDVTPDRIGLGGRTFDNTEHMRAVIHKGLTQCTTMENTIALMSILDAVDHNSEFKNTHVLAADKSRITSDFGEVVSAYVRVKNGKEVFFPKESNYPGVDFFAGGVGVSAKGDKGSSRLSTIDYAEQINELGDSNVESVFKHLSQRQIFDMINVAADACPQLKYWKSKLGKITQDAMAAYIQDNTYDTYLDDVRACQDGAGIAIPKKEEQCRVYWSKGDINPLLFTFCTLIDRYYSVQNAVAISETVAELFKESDIEFEYFDYNIEDNSISINILPITQYTQWKINYWGNAASALNNWPAVEGIG
jgi:hypothetical protein